MRFLAVSETETQNAEDVLLLMVFVFYFNFGCIEEGKEDEVNRFLLETEMEKPKKEETTEW